MTTLRYPVSTRHAFALAFDLAVRRDPVHSLLVPLLLRSPWIVTIAMLPPMEDSDQPLGVLLLSTLASAGDFLMLLVTTAMQRFRARSVFNTPLTTHPAPAIDCYAQGLGRVPWLLLTEVVRNALLIFATFFFIIPGIYLGYRLAFSTEAVVLNESHMAGALQRSFKLTEKRFERWFEMCVLSVLLILGAALLTAILAVTIRGLEVSTWVVVLWLLVVALTPVIQYAWTFFYLRLVEVEDPPIQEVGPMYATATPPVAEAPAGNGGPHITNGTPATPPPAAV